MTLKHEVTNNPHQLPVRIVEFKRSWQGRSYPWHWHESIELVYNLNSNITYHVGSATYDLQPDELLLINSYAPHRLDTVSNNGYYVLILIDYQFIEKWTKGKYYRDFLFNTLIAVQETKGKQRLREIILKLIELNRHANDLNELKINAHALELLGVLYEYYQVTESVVLSQSSNIELIHYIKQNIRQELTLRQVAEHFSYNYAYLSRRFNKQMNRSFSNYINTLRIDLSMPQLMNNNYSIQAVATNVGFNSTRSYLRAFQKYYSLSPTEFRKIHTAHPEKAIKNYLI